MARPRVPKEPQPEPEHEPKLERDAEADALEPPELPPRLVAIGYVIALVCLVAPLAILGAAFAGAVLYQRGRRGAGAGVIVVAVASAAVGVLLLR